MMEREIRLRADVPTTEYVKSPSSSSSSAASASFLDDFKSRFQINLIQMDDEGKASVLDTARTLDLPTEHDATPTNNMGAPSPNTGARSDFGPNTRVRLASDLLARPPPLPPLP